MSDLCPITPLSLADISTWQPPASSIVFVGPQAHFHAQAHAAGLQYLSSKHPHLSQHALFTVGLSPTDLIPTLQAFHAKKVLAVIFTAPLKRDALLALSPPHAPGAAKDSSTKVAFEVIHGLGAAEAAAERIGAVNLALWRPNGYWGLSTDGDALSWVLSRKLSALMRGQPVVIIGVGAFGRAVAVQALSTGCQSIWLSGRNQDAVLTALMHIVPSPQMQMRSHRWNHLKPSGKVPTRGIIVNTLPADAEVRESFTASVPFSHFIAKDTVYFDITLSSTPQLVEAQRLGMLSCNACSLFAYQVTKHLELITGQAPSVEAILEALS